MNIVSRIPLEKQTLETIMVLKHKLWVNWIVLFFYVFFFFFFLTSETGNQMWPAFYVALLPTM